MTQTSRRPSFRAAITYRDPMAALEWLEKAFGFDRSMLITDRDGNFGHAEMQHGDGTIMVGSEWAEFVASPASVGGKNTQLLHVHVEGDIDDHCKRARAAGATIMEEPRVQFYGDRTYRARDLEGHIWVFGQTFAR